MLSVLAEAMADVAGRGYVAVSPFIGALGSFMSGSNTVSNILFSSLQYETALLLDLPTAIVVALQVVGGGIGNMVCINNIVAVCSILMLDKSEGLILKRTVVAMVVYGVIAGLVSFILGGF